ncbi:TetR/AcrR family transcriptional regulator [Paenibacillus sp. SYP-B4298]|uniref:TetR/AcrR family transcriptional regulator n=1 Tax=Paenibacillus sp. SYP-B4298 TaxID=2996034 RepID=UPI0022DDC66B|nr:TetR family transcriptional regulator C-terminal domain-containing protein [Paenibacillus sp. SYP-B4298]
MPKIVDHHQRKEQLAEAAWRIIRREGLDSVSVRRVASEIGMSLGSVRHYFHSQDELLTFSMELVSRRVNERILNSPYTGDIRQDMERVIWEMMPLDEVRRGEAEIWLAFAGRASSDESVAAISLSVHKQIREGLEKFIRLLVEQGHAAYGELDADFEAARLHALVDGLVVHAITRPELITPEQIKDIVSHHLDHLFAR